MIYYPFPYDKVGKNTKIVIYGAGKVGRDYLRQLLLDNYCQVVAIIDQSYGTIDGTYSIEKIPIYTCEFLVDKSQEFDSLVIAIKNDSVAHLIENNLIEKYYIAKNKIVRTKVLEYDLNQILRISSSQLFGDMQYISIAIALEGGLGDCIIIKRFIEELYANIQGKCYIDLFGYEKNASFIKSVFKGCTYIRSIYTGAHEYARMPRYMLVIRSGYFIEITSVKLTHIRMLDKKFALKMERLQKKIQEYGLKLSSGKDNGIHFARCKLKKCNCYTAYNYDGLFDFSDVQVTIPLEKKYVSNFRQLHMGAYITFTYGWGEQVDNNVMPSKIWPADYFERLLSMIKASFPNLQIVQIGAGNNQKIRGADRYLLGQSLELSKHILKNSFLHIDSEGGLVHLASQLGTKCVVMFGPTPVHYFGYKNNINIVSEACNNCCYLYDNFAVCARGLSEPECMRSIKPEKVFVQVEKYLNNCSGIDSL